MIKLNENALFTLLLIAFVSVILSLTFGLGRVGRLVPLTVAIPALGLLAFQLMLDLWPQVAKNYSRLEKKDLFRVEPLREKSRANTSSEGAAERMIRRGRESIAFLWLALIFLLIYLFGFLIALPAFTFLYLKVRSGEGWIMSVLRAAGMCVLVYGVFMLALDIRLHEGQVWHWFGN